jgi:hypothetical protein
MPIIAKSKGGDFPPLPVGLQHAVCYGVVDIGTQPQINPKFRASRKVVFMFELPGERIELEREGKMVNLPRAISETFTLSLGSKSNLRPMLEGWRGREFTAAELEAFDVSKVCGANCFLNIVHKQKDGKTYANIGGINPLPKGMKPISVENPRLVFTLDDFPGSTPVTFPANMPEWIKGKIIQSEEYMRKQDTPAEPVPTSDGQREDNTGGEFDDEIPFD